MSNLEKKIDALIRLHLCDSMAERSEILKSLREMVRETEVMSTPAPVDYPERIRSALLEMGVPDSLKGHRYLMYAVQETIINPEVTEQMTKVLYPKIAEKFNTTPSRVERGIRHAVEVSWDRADFDTLNKYFGSTVSPSKGKPTNTEFISRMANELR